MNTKFVNNLPAYWGKYVTNVKQNMDISTTPYVQIYTHLKAYEPHAKKTLKKQEQSTSIVDPLAYVAHTTSAPALSSPSTPSPQPTAQFPPTNNQLRTSSNSRTHATVHDGHIVTEPVQRKAPEEKDMWLGSVKNPRERWTSQYFKDKALLMKLKRKEMYGGMEGPNAADRFHGQIVIHQSTLIESEMHQEEHLDSDAETEIDDNTIPYHQYHLLDTEAQNVPTEVSADTSDKIYD
ncbi:hypothetical protein Tco_0810622 [Tanacetum coccineum]